MIYCLHYLDSKLNIQGEAMQAIEFEANTQNGVILLPKELQALNKTHMKFIALFDETTDETGNVAKALSFLDKAGSYNLSWEAEKLSREQMNER